MRILLRVLGGLLALGWCAVAADYFIGARRSRSLDAIPPLDEEEPAPPLSIVVPACNEIERMPQAFRSLLAQEYPGPLQIVAVDDRSTDGTGEMLDMLAGEAPAEHGICVLHLDALPAGWMGKNHALWQGAQRATGDWILFTDADVVFAPRALSRAVAYAERNRLDHLVSFFRLELHGFWENAFGMCFSLLFFLKFRPWHVRNPRRPEYLGVGGFNLVRRSAYEALGTHRIMALEVADDMELGRRLKRAGFRADVVGAADEITLRWQEGLFGLMGGLIKNAYAGLHYSPAEAGSSIGLLLLTIVWPAIGALIARDRTLLLYHSVSLLGLLSVAANHARVSRIPIGYALTLPLSTPLLISVIVKSAVKTEREGGITWRDTFYPLPMLRAGEIPPPPPLAG